MFLAQGLLHSRCRGLQLLCSTTLLAPHFAPMQVALDAVQYARSGAFSVNLWFKPGNMSGDSLSYLFSHRGTTNSSNATANTGWGPNQIQVGGRAAAAMPAVVAPAIGRHC